MPLNPNWNRHLEKWGKEVTIAKYLDNGQVTTDDIALIEKHIVNKRTKGTLGDAKADQIIKSLCYWRKFIAMPYRQITIDDVEAGVCDIKAAKNRWGKPYSQNSLHTYIADLKSFVVFLNKKKVLAWNADDMDTLKDIKTPAVDVETTEPKELLSPDEMLTILNGVVNPMHAAYIAVSYESAGRPEEVGSLTWADIEADKYGYKCWLEAFKTDGKGNTKKRFTRLTFSAPYLSTWKKANPDGKPGNFIFIGRGGNPISLRAAESIFERAAAKSIPDKHVTLYRMRKSRITEMYKLGMNDSAVTESVWGNQSTRMKRIYVKLSNEDVDKALLSGAGIVKEEHKVPALTVKTCNYCHEQNKPTAEFCSGCGRPLSKDARIQIDNLEEKAKADTAKIDVKALKDNPEFIALMKDILDGKV